MSSSLIMAVLAFWAVQPVNAAVVENLYSVALPVVDQKLKNRQSAFNSGLKQVLIRVTGSRSNLSSIRLPNASSYVKQFQYRELNANQKEIVAQQTKQLEAKGKADKSRIPTQSLWVQYNETKVNEFIQKNALPSWNEHRVESVVWIAVNDGVNRYVLKGLDKSLLKTVTDESAIRRAIPMVWPDVQQEDQAIRFADVWAGFQGPLKDISRQFSTGPIIVGKLLWDGKKWNSEWLLLNDEQQTEWSIDHSDYNKLITVAVDKVADKLGQQYARFDTDEINALHALSIEIQNVNSISSLGHVKEYLLSIPQVEDITLKRIQRDSVFYDVSLKSKTEEFLAFIGTGETISVIPENEQIDTGETITAQNKVIQSEGKGETQTPINIQAHNQNKDPSNQPEPVQNQSPGVAFRFRFN